MADKIIVMEGAMQEFSVYLDAKVSCIPLDFAQAFRSLAHQWMHRLLLELGCRSHCDTLSARCIRT